jgi:hypothetical protein
MRIAVLSILVLLLTIGAQAQSPVAKDILKMMDQIPAPPKNVAGALAKVAFDKNAGAGSCDAATLFTDFDKSTKEVNDAFVAGGKPGEKSLPPGVSPGMMQKAKDPEMKKKMKGMSKEEKMKMAMEMMGSMPAPSVQPESPAVRAALEEWQKIYNSLGQGVTTPTAEQQKDNEEAIADEKAHADVSDWERREVDKLPMYSSGEMSAHDPAQVKAVRLKGADKHIALANTWLHGMQKRWESAAAKVRAKYARFQEKLAAARYAEESKNYSTRKILSDAQLIMMKDVARIAGQSRDAWEKSASWGAQKVLIEAQ